MDRKIKNMLIFTISSIMLILLTTISYAASFTPKISATDVKVGDTITITVKADNAAGMYNVKVNDSSILEVISGSTSEFLENNSATIKLKAKKAGSTTVNVTPSDMTDLDDSTKSVSEGGKTYTVKVAEVTTSVQDKDTTTNKNTNTTNKDTAATEKPKEKSNNAYLKTLGVRISNNLAKELGVKTDEYDFSGFSKTKTSYSVTIPKNINSLKVVATAGENGTVKVSGNSGFEVGSDNKITIVVTSENGKTTKTYTIKVTQLAEEEEKPGNLIEEDSELYLTSLTVGKLNLSPEFDKDTYSYTATLDDSKLTELNVDAVANNEKAKIDISGNTELVEGENTINIVLTLDGSSEQTVYQVVVTKKAETVSTTTTTLENTPTSTTDLIGKIKNYAVIAIAVIALIVVAVIVLILLLRRENKRLQEDENTPDLNSEEYNVYKKDQNEFGNKDLEKNNFIESLYKQRNGTLDEEDLTEDEKETLEEINKQTEEIFREKVEGQTVEYNSNEIEENLLETKRKKRGKHSL